MIRVLQFADVANGGDFIDILVQRCDPVRFDVGLCVRSAESRIAPVRMPAGRYYRVLGGACSRAGIPRAVAALAHELRQRRVNVLHAHHYDQALIAMLAVRLAPDTRLVIGRHYSDSIYRLPGGWKRRTLLALEQAVNRAANRIIAPSRMIADILRRQNVPEAKIARIPYAFDPDRFPLPTPGERAAVRRAESMDGFVAGCFARLHEEKGHHFLLRALAQEREGVREVRLLIVGDGPERGALEKLASSLGLDDRVRFAGWRRNARALMGAVDAVVQPTLQEAFSQAMVEAMLMERPLVMSEVSGAADVIEDGVHGVLVPPGDVDALASALRRLQVCGEEAAAMGRRARRRVETELQPCRIIPLYERVFEEVADV